LQNLIDASQAHVNGAVRVKLYKGNVIIAGRKSDDSLFDMNIATLKMTRALMTRRMQADSLSSMRCGCGSRR
jgi:argininosuccinate synthase